MIRSVSIFLIPFCLVSFLAVYAAANGNSNRMEENYIELGYTTAEDARQDFQEHYHSHVKLPIRLPPIPFTHRLGRATISDDGENDVLEIIYSHEKSPENHFKLEIRPNGSERYSSEQSNSTNVLLDNGTPATFLTNSIQGFHLLVFEADGWQYLMGIDERVEDQVSLDDMVHIANSIVNQFRQ